MQDKPPGEVAVETFFEVDIRVGRVLAAELNPKARKPAYRLDVDFGPLGTRTSSAQLTALYRPDDLIDRQVLAVVNFPPRRIAGVESQVLVLGVADPDGTSSCWRPSARRRSGRAFTDATTATR